jgi:hypothetical protein
MSTKKNVLWFGAVFILVLSVITFVFIPTSRGSASQTPVFGKWDGTPIEYAQDSYFVRQIQNISRQMQSQGQQIDQYNYFQVLQSAFNSAVIRLGMLEELKKAGYKVPDSLVNKNLVSYYLDENGKYSAKLFADTPETTRASRRATLAEELTAQRYTDDYYGSSSGLFGLKNSSKETDLIKTMSSPERSFTYVGFDTSKYPESEIVAWGKDNPAQFVKHSLSLVTLATEEEAKKVAAKITKGTITFDEAVTTYSTRTGTDTAGKLTDSFRNSVNTLFADAKDLETVLALQPSAVGPVVKAGSSWAIVRCDAAPVDPDFADSSVIAAVTSWMNANERGKIEDYFMAKAREFASLAKASGFDAACAANGVEKKTTTAFALNYGSSTILRQVPVSENPALASADKNETFLKAAFALPAGDVSEPVLLGTNVVVLQLLEDKAADASILELIPMYFNYYSSSWSQGSVSETFLSSKKLENNFMETYIKNFLN